MDTHVTVDDLARLRSGALDASSVLRVGRHLAACRECAAAARRSQQTPAVADGFRDALREPETRRRWKPALLATAAIAVIGVSIATLYRPPARIPPPVRRAPLLVRTASEFDYGRADWNALVANALATAKIEFPADLRTLHPERGAVRGGGTAARLEPAGAVVESGRPTFSWSGVPNAVTYTVLVYRGEREVTRSGELRTRVWTPEQPLERGLTYRWEVLVTRNDGTMEVLPSPPVSPALLRILDAVGAADVAEARRRSPPDPLLVGLVEARHGLIEAARRDLDAAAQERKDSAVTRLRDSLPREH
jgi:hypothetical protein